MSPCASLVVRLAFSMLVLPAPANDAVAAEPAAADAAPAQDAADPGPATADEPLEPAGAAAPAAADGADIVVTDREAEFAKLAPRLAVGDELQWLEATGHEFVALQRKPRQGPPKGAILIVPAPQELLDQRELTRSLRSLPPAGGFVTLAMQPPLAAAPAAEAGAEANETATPPLHAELCARVSAALAALEASLHDVKTPLIAIAAADASVPAVLGCAAAGLPADVRAFAAIGRWQGDFGALPVPSIEFVPTLDTAAVRAAERRAALPLADTTPPRRRVDLDGVDGRLDGAGEDVAKRLRGWLERLPPPRAAERSAAPASKSES